MYPSDLNDEEWAIIEPYVCSSRGIGRKRTVDRRSIVNAIFYQSRTGCQWRMLPKDFPNYTLVMHYYYNWMRKGIWEKMHEVLVAKCRSALGKKKRQPNGRYN